MKKWNGKTPFIKGHSINKGIPRTEELKNKLRNENSPNWKGDKVSIKGLHAWIKRHYGKADRCEKCGIKGKRYYDWANLDHKYSRERKDWKMMCRSCHMKYDFKNGLRKDKR